MELVTWPPLRGMAPRGWLVLLDKGAARADGPSSCMDTDLSPDSADVDGFVELMGLDGLLLLGVASTAPFVSLERSSNSSRDGARRCEKLEDSSKILSSDFETK